MKRTVSQIALVVSAVASAFLAKWCGMTGKPATEVNVFYWYVFPPVMFLFLFVLTLIRPGIRMGVLWASAAGAIIGLLFPYILLTMDLAKNQGRGGGNLGMLVCFVTPLTVSVMMYIGACLAEYFYGRNLKTAHESR